MSQRRPVDLPLQGTKEDILDIVPTEIHQKAPVIMGSSGRHAGVPGDLRKAQEPTKAILALAPKQTHDTTLF